MDAYSALEARFARLSAIEDALSILHWDAQTIMPSGSAEGRSEQIATLEGIAHELLTAAKTRDLLDEAEQGREALTVCPETSDRSSGGRVGG